MTGNFDDIYDVNSIFLKTASEKIHESFGSTESELNKHKKEAFSIKMPEAMKPIKSPEFDLSGLPTRHQARMMMMPLQVPKLPDPPSSKLNLKTTELPQVPKFPDPTQLSGAVLDSKTTEIPQFNMRKPPSLKPLQTKPFTTSTEFNDPSAGFSDLSARFSQYEATLQEEKNKATRTRVEAAIDEQKKAISSSGFSSWSKQQTANEMADGRINAYNDRMSKQSANLYKESTEKENKIKEAKNKEVRDAEEYVANVEKAQRLELNSIGPDNEKGYVSSAVGGTSRSWRKNHTNEENRFIDARRYYAKNLDTIEQQKSRIIAAKDSFLKNYDESMISDESMGKMKAAFEEAKSEHNQSILEAKRAGRSAPLLNDAKVNSQINSQIAQKVFGKAEDAELAAVDYMRKKNNAEGIIARAENRNSVLRKYIDSAQEKGENKIARGAKAGGLGWKGKAAIFGGVALGALALVGVASMVMSGGRQQNSNLYNPYQAMY